MSPSATISNGRSYARERPQATLLQRRSAQVVLQGALEESRLFDLPHPNQNRNNKSEISWDEQPRQASLMVMSPKLLGRLVDEHAAALVLYARQWSSAPEDIVQEAFLKLVAHQPPPDKPLAWLYRVVRNEAINAWRAAQRRRRHENIAAARMQPWFVPVSTTALDADAAARALHDLPIEQRESIVAHLWGGLSFEQIAELTGTSSSTAHRCYVAGLSALRERLGVPCPNKAATPT
jgi:RNA polymerase sigma factor (sigma-70 family)